MTKSKICALMTAVAMCALAQPAYAGGTVSSVTIDICPEVDDLKPGEIAEAVEPEVSSGQATVYDFAVDASNLKKMLAYYYDVTIVPKDGYEFADNLSVSAKGGAKVEVKNVSAAGADLRITTYPFFRLENPSNIEEESDGFSWKKVANAKKYNVTTYYEDEDGDEKKKSESVSKPEIEYNESFLDSYDITGVSVQAIAGSSDIQYKFVLPSEYVTMTGEVDEELRGKASGFSFPSSSDKKGSSGAKTTVKNASSKHSGNSGPTAIPDAGWVKSPTGTWFKNPDGTWPANQWLYIQNSWYFFNESGYLVQDRWMEWNGQWYCLDKNGKMYSKCWTPDGFYVDENGAWVREAIKTK